MQLRFIDKNTPADLRPSAVELASLRVGQTVSICLTTGERLWALVLQHNDDGTFAGRLADNAATDPGARIGVQFTFERKHVLEIV